MLISGGCASLSPKVARTRVLGANDRLRIAVAGVHGRGKSHIKGYFSIPNVEVAYLVDPDKKVLAARLADLRKKTEEKGEKFTCKGVTDIRTVPDEDVEEIRTVGDMERYVESRAA